MIHVIFQHTLSYSLGNGIFQKCKNYSTIIETNPVINFIQLNLILLVKFYKSQIINILELALK